MEKEKKEKSWALTKTLLEYLKCATPLKKTFYIFFAVTLLTSLSLQPYSIGSQHGLWTDKYSYCVGDPVIIQWNIEPPPGYVVIMLTLEVILYKPNGEVVYLSRDGGYSGVVTTVADYSLGIWRVILVYNNSTEALESTTFEVKSCEKPDYPSPTPPSPTPPSPTPPPKDSCAPYDEANVRYIMADISLGGPIGYYRDHSHDRNAVEAVRRWDAGIRVTNAGKFERKYIGGTWLIVYRGTETMIDGMDVRLTVETYEYVYCRSKCYEGELWKMKCENGKCVKDRRIETCSSMCGCGSCVDVTCGTVCRGYDLWSQNCINGSCVHDQLIEANSTSCGFVPCQDHCTNGKQDCEEYGVDCGIDCPFKDSDEDGIEDCRDLCWDSRCNEVDTNGCETDMDGDGIGDCEDECPNERGNASQEGCPNTNIFVILAGVGGVLVVGGSFIYKGIKGTKLTHQKTKLPKHMRNDIPTKREVADQIARKTAEKAEASKSVGMKIGEEASKSVGMKIGEEASKSVGMKIGEEASKSVGMKIGEEASKSVGMKIGEEASKSVGMKIGEESASESWKTIENNKIQCPNCGKRMLPDSNFCSNCGCKIERT